ncbi:hypothetical protein ACHAP6_004147 [Verticillium nonalfalfae]
MEVMFWINLALSVMVSATIYLILWSTFAIAAQGAGCLIAFMISSAFIYRLMTQKLPRDAQRPGVVGAIP